ncbi:MAG: sulfur carrier protein ThiS [Myxococcaceae bacterium]|nr:sulfur carrier protein ThiS [Myxococcaceae bacterium]
MQVHVNGEPKEIADGLTLSELLDTLKIERARVAVEVNAEVVRRARHGEVKLKAGDQIEIVTFVGGG